MIKGNSKVNENHCPFAREVWRLSPLDEGFEVSRLTDLRDDWEELQPTKCLPPTGIISTPLTPWIMWFLWKARNKHNFENCVGNPAETLAQAIIAAKEWETAQEKETRQVIRPRGRPIVEVSSVIRTDAAWSESNGNTGLGLILKEAEQSTRGGRGVSFISSPLIAEALALRDAVSICRNRGVRSVRFESDSNQLIAAINTKSPPLALHGIVEDILLFALEFEVIFFVWIPRSENSEADWLAKHALSLYEQELGGTLVLPPK